MGEVFVAEQRKPVNRIVALKLIKRGMDSKDVVARFEAERQALAMMNHPNIASVLDVGETDDGRPYFVMELVRGYPITTYCEQHKLNLRQRLELMVTVCQAVQHAHQKGVIHRDLKPGNILVELDDVRHVPKVIDFGVAKATNQRLTEHTLYTQQAQMIGTPLYMSPEQAQLTSSDVDTRSDVYSLGVLLYELLTGSTPFDRDTLTKAGYDEMRRIIREDEPPRPSHRISTLRAEQRSTHRERSQEDTPQIERQVHGELGWIVMKALEKDRVRRYQSASALGADVQCYLSGDLVEACPPSTVYRMRKFARRNRGLVKVASVVSILILIAAGLLWNERSRTLAALTRETQEHQQAEVERSRWRELSYVSDMNLASDALHAGDVPRVVSLLDRHRRTGGEEDQRDFVWHYLQNSVSANRNWEVDLGSAINDLETSPNGKKCCVALGDGQILIYQVETGQLLQSFHTSSAVNSAAWDPSGRNIVSANADGYIYVWDLDSLSTDADVEQESESHSIDDLFSSVATPSLSIAAHTGEANSVAITPNAKTIVSGGDDGMIRTWDSMTGQVRSVLRGHQREVEEIAVSSGGRFLGSASSDGTLRQWDLITGDLVKSWDSPSESRMTAVAFSADGKLIAGGDIFGSLIVADVDSGFYANILQMDAIESIAFLGNSHRLATGDRAGAIHVWNVVHQQDGKHLMLTATRQWAAHRDRVQCLTALFGGRTILSVSRGGSITSFSPRFESTAFAYNSGLSFATGDVRTLLSCDHEVYQYDMDLREITSKTNANANRWNLIAAAQSCPWVVVADQQGTIVVYDRELHKEIAHWQVELAPHRIAISPRGRHVAVCYFDRSHQVELFDVMRPSDPRMLAARQCHCIAFRGDGRMLAVGSMDELLLYDLDVAGPPRALVGHDPSMIDASFSPDGRLIVTGGGDRRLKLWDVATGAELCTTEAHRKHVRSVDFSDDGRLIATGGQQSLVRIWLAKTLQPLLEIRVNDPIRQVRFASQDRRLIVQLGNGEIHVFDFLAGTCYYVN